MGKQGAGSARAECGWGALAAALLVVVFAIRLVTLGTHPLIDPSESRYAEIAREMATSGDWVTPRLEPETPFWGKPPLYFWAVAFSLRMFGESAFTARLASLGFALLTAALAGLLGARLFGRATGLVAAGILATSALFFILAGTVLTDPALLATVTLSCVALPMAIREGGPRARGLWTLLFFAGLGASALSKGLVGPVLVGGTSIVWGALVSGQRGSIRRLPWRRGAILALAIALPWHLAAEIRTPGFLEYYLWGEHVARYLVSGYDSLYGDAHQHARGTIWLFFVAGALPWSGVAAVIALRAGRWRRLTAALRDPWNTYLLVWMLVPLLFFTLSRNIMFSYALPALPPFAIGLARILTSMEQARAPAHALVRRRFAALALAVPLVVFVASVVVLPALAARLSQRALVERLDELDPAHEATLVYTDEMPPSGDFYAGGRAIELPEEALDRILAHIEDTDVDYYAIEDNDLRQFPAIGFERTCELGRFGRYMLRGEIQGAGHRPSGPPCDRG